MLVIMLLAMPNLLFLLVEKYVASTNAFNSNDSDTVWGAKM